MFYYTFFCPFMNNLEYLIHILHVLLQEHLGFLLYHLSLFPQEHSGISERTGSKGRMSLRKGDKSKQRDSYCAEQNGKFTFNFNLSSKTF